MFSHRLLSSVTSYCGYVTSSLRSLSTSVPLEAPPTAASTKVKSALGGWNYATGKRKNSIARVFMRPATSPGSGNLSINGRTLQSYFCLPMLHSRLFEPFLVAATSTATVKAPSEYDIMVTVKGGGTTGQAEAIRHGLSKLVEHESPSSRAVLKDAGLLTRDPRVVERKKPGQKKARKKFQWVKR